MVSFLSNHRLHGIPFDKKLSKETKVILLRNRCSKLSFDISMFQFYSNFSIFPSFNISIFQYYLCSIFILFISNSNFTILLFTSSIFFFFASTTAGGALLVKSQLVRVLRSHWRNCCSSAICFSKSFNTSLRSISLIPFAPKTISIIIAV